MTIDDIIAEANLAGLLLNQLFQYPDGTWRAEWKLQLEDVCHWATSTGRGAIRACRSTKSSPASTNSLYKPVRGLSSDGTPGLRRTPGS